MTRFFFMLNSLHTLEQKGVSSHCVANALVTILQETIGRRNAGRDFMEKAWPEVWEDMLKVEGDELFYAYMVDNQAIVIPETIDAIRALTEAERDGSASIARTNAALGVGTFAAT